MTKSFTKKASIGQKQIETEGKEDFIRSKKDNTLFANIQVKDLKPLLTEDVINYIDADGFAFKVSSSVEEDYIEVTNNTTKEKTKHSNVSEWKGRGRKEGAISIDSTLGRMNLKLEAKGQTPYEISDFSVEKKKRLKYEDGTTIDGIKFKDTISVAKYFLSEWISAVKIQTQVDNVQLVIGSGKCHRNFLDLPKDYKANRIGSARPLLLNEVRKHILDEYPSEEAPSGFETDEIVDMKAFKHYLMYRKTGCVSGIKTSPDKDARATAGFLFDPTKTYHFNQPQVWLIEASDKTVGELELAKSGMKFTGLMGTAYQCVISDTSDFYGSRLTMPDEMKPDVVYGDVAFYKDFINLTKPKEVLQKMVDKFLDFYPTGVQFTSHLGNIIDEDTLWWLQQVFACQYMLRSLDDKANIKSLLDRCEVDYSKLVNNNAYTAPVKTYIGNEAHVSEVEGVLSDIVTNSFKGLKAMKKVDQGVILDSIKEKLLSINFESHYELQQTLKEGFEV